MAAAVTTTVTELAESRVRVDAEVPAAEVEKSINRTAKAIGRDLKMPGFRKGKVPPPVVLRRVGREAVLDEAIRGSLTEWYVAALDQTGLATVGTPALSVGELPEEGQPLTFSIEIGVRPKATLGKYKGLEVGRREAAPADEDIEREIEALRERLARLDTVEREAAADDFIVLDYAGTVEGEPLEGAEGRDQLAQLGAGRLLEGMDEVLVGASAGDEREFTTTVPEDHPNEDLRGKPLTFQLTVKEVREKQLPDVNDDFASDAAGFDTLDELRQDIRSKLSERLEAQVEAEFREAAADAAAAEAKIDLPASLVEARAQELVDNVMRQLARQGVSREAYLELSGRGEEELVNDAKEDAERGLKREAVLAAIVEAEGIEPSEDELLTALEHPAEHENTTAPKLLERIRDAGRLDSFKADLATRKAVDLLAAEAKPIPLAQAEARERIWTPEQEEDQGAAGGESKLWTPGS
jgi:trigger factor